jgi:trehalose 6-phosphate phosphatase
MSGFILPPPPLMPDQAPVGRAALFLDFDGTLVEIASRPDAVRVPPGLPGLLRRVRCGLGGALAVVSGRSLSALDAYLPVPLAMAGDHGATIRVAPGLPVEAPPLPVPPASWRSQAVALAKRHPGMLVEAKTHGFAVHFRQAPAAGAGAEALLAALVLDSPFQLLAAHMAWEVRPRGPSKASAVRRLMQAPAFAGRVPVFIGDDVTDEAGMEAARALGGFGWRLQDAFGTPAALRGWLAQTVASSASLA